MLSSAVQRGAWRGTGTGWGGCMSACNLHTTTPRVLLSECLYQQDMWFLQCLFCWVQHPGSITQTDAADIETDGVDSDDDNDVLKSDQVCLST